MVGVCIAFGFIMGVLSTILYCLHKVKKLGIAEGEDELNKIAEKMKEKVNEARTRINSVKDRLGEVYSISKRQQDLQAALDMPSTNALHSRHKNGIVAELKELEEQKYNILQSILKDGFDPLINVINEDNTKEEMKLSQFVAKMNGAHPLEEGELPPDNKPAVEKDEIDKELENLPRKAGKFVVYTGKGKKPTNH